MRLVTPLAPLLVILTIGRAASSASDSPKSDAWRNFDAWRNHHSKYYATYSEYARRLAIYAANSAIVSRHNVAYDKGYTGYAMTIDGPFADLTNEEFQALYLMEGQNCSATHVSSGPVPDGADDGTIELPKSVDWRTKGVVTPVKSQGHCGSCWTFSTSGTLEAHHCIDHSKDCTQWRGLSEQQLVDCAGDFNNNGCSGGLPSQAFEYIHYSGGLAFEESYKYKAKDGTCHPVERKDIGARVRGVHNISTHDEDGIVKAVAKHGPVAVAFDVSPDFRFYSHGVYDSFNATTNKTMCLSDAQHVNHAVVAVGYGETMEDQPVSYHIIRNSWGNAWGMEGYFWMKMGENMCGISDCASYPLVRSKPDEENNEEVDLVHEDDAQLDAHVRNVHILDKVGLTAEMKDAFSNWIVRHQKSYQTEEEYVERLWIYASNAALVANHNDAREKGLTSYSMSLDGPFADLTFEEFKDTYLMEARQCYPTHTSSGPVPVGDNLDLPKSVDWRTKGVMTPVKAQGHCGSCWTFASTGTLEAHHCIAELLDCSQWSGLSEQQLVDCAGGHFGNNGCGGGWPSTAMEYVEYAGGIATEDSYKYTAKSGKCHFKKERMKRDIGAKVRRVHNITSFDEDDLVKAIAHVGPVAVAFDVAGNFHLYSHGVYDSYDANTKENACETDLHHLNHAVVAIGYGETMEEPPKPFHIIRNSWGDTWGMGGHFWILRGKNMCGISDCAAYPDVRPSSALLLRKRTEQRVEQK